MISVKVSQPTLDEFNRRYKASLAALKDKAPAYKQLAAYLDGWVQRNFASQGGRVGGWAPYRYGGRLTTKSKANAQSIEGRHWINGAAVLLQDTGRLRISFLPFVDGDNVGVGSELPYSKTHEEGLPEKNVPQRRILPRDADVRPAIIKILENFILASTKGMR